MNDDNAQSQGFQSSQLIELYREIFETLRHEGNGIWARFNILVGINLALFAAVGLLAFGSNRPTMWRGFSILISFGGLVTAAYAIYVLSQLWQRHWQWRLTLVHIQHSFPRGWPTPIEPKENPPFKLTQPFLCLFLVGWFVLFGVLVFCPDAFSPVDG